MSGLQTNAMSRSEILTAMRSIPTTKGFVWDDLDEDDLPATDGLRLWLDGTIRIIIRPSGTEAKMKCYIEVIEKDSQRAQNVLDQLRTPLKEFLS